MAHQVKVLAHNAGDYKDRILPMLGLFKSKSEHPLVSPREAKAICADLMRMEAARGLDEAAGWFASLAGVDGFPARLRLERLQELVTASLAHTRRQSRDYLTDTSLQRLQQQQQWQRNFEYWQHLAEALQRCRDEAAASKDQQTPILASLLAALGQQLRWLRLRHNQGPAELWRQLGQAYLQAVQLASADCAVATLGAGEGNTTPAQEYLKVLVFQASSLDNLNPVEIVLAERLIGHFLPRFVLSVTAFPGCVFWIDAEKPAPPARLTQMPTAAHGIRYLSPGDGLAGLRQMREQILVTHQLPREIAGVEALPAEAVLRVIDHLLQCWSAKPPLRKNARHRIASDVYVIHGLGSLPGYLSGSDTRLEGIETWVIEDVSQGGIGARLSINRNDWAQVGVLVGFQPEGVGAWHIGIIRRFTRQSESEGAAGIETLSKQPRPLSVMDSGLNTDLLLLDALQDDGSVRVLIAPSYWEDGTAFVTLLDGRPWRLHADEKLEAAEDWLLGRCIAEQIRD